MSEASNQEPTEEELALVALLIHGLADEVVRERLGWSRRTIRRHLKSAMDKLGARSRFEAGFRVAKAGWLDGHVDESPKC